MKRMLRIVIIAFPLMLVAAGLAWGFFSGRAEVTQEDQADTPIQGASRVSTQDGSTVLSMPVDAQRANGIVVTALTGERRSIESSGNAVVVDLQPILSLESSYNSATMDVAKARASAAASGAEFERLQRLNHDGQNASEKSVEAARAASDSDAAVEQNAEQTLSVLESSIALRWGPAIARWIESGSPHLNALLAQRMFLLQVTVPGSAVHAATAAIVNLPDGKHASAQLLSTLPQLDPRLQSPSFLYLLPAQARLVPGMNLSVSLPAGPAQRGVVVPETAVVWWQGKAWCYVEHSPGKFTREAVPTKNPVANGWFVTASILPGMRVVTSGAQTLLSEEFRSELQADQDQD